jgi:hypothetical protein
VMHAHVASTSLPGWPRVIAVVAASADAKRSSVCPAPTPSRCDYTPSGQFEYSSMINCKRSTSCHQKVLFRGQMVCRQHPCCQHTCSVASAV